MAITPKMLVPNGNRNVKIEVPDGIRSVKLLLPDETIITCSSSIITNPNDFEGWDNRGTPSKTNNTNEITDPNGNNDAAKIILGTSDGIVTSHTGLTPDANVDINIWIYSLDTTQLSFDQEGGNYGNWTINFGPGNVPLNTWTKLTENTPGVVPTPGDEDFLIKPNGSFNWKIQNLSAQTKTFYLWCAYAQEI